MAKYYKSYSTYVEKKFHQLTNSSRVYEQDKVTIGGTNSFAAGRIPMYAESNFKFTVRQDIYGQKKHHFGNWIPNCEETSELWTMDNIDSCEIPMEESSNDVNRKSNNLLDYAFYGSCTELIRASVEDIIRKFPAELYFSDRKQEYITQENEISYIDGWLVENPFLIDLFSSYVAPSEMENEMRYFCASYLKYEVIIDGVARPVTSFSSVPVEGLDMTCLIDGQKMKDITIGYEGGSVRFAMHYSSGDRVLIYTDNSYFDFHIRPNLEVVDSFFEELDGFQSLMLQRDTNPIYKMELLTPIDTKKGYVFTLRDYIFPVRNGWNLDIDGFSYSRYLSNLSAASRIYDELFSDNLYRSMTHEAIKNFDWTYTREYTDGEEEDYVSGGTRITNLIRLYGRGFDDIKRYADGITFTQNVTYDGNNNIQESLIKSKLENDGWVIKTTIPTGKESEKVPVLFYGNNKGYTYTEAHQIFLRNLFLNSKHILRAKGTKRAIEMVIGLFGIDRSWYDLKEYVYTVSPITNNIDTIIELNRNKNVIRQNYDYDYEGILVRELYDLDENNNKVNRRLYPWYQNGAVYDGDVVFQSKGGWGKYNLNGNTRYRETSSYINVVSEFNDLTSLPIKSLNVGDIYYVSNAHGYPSNFFKLANVDNCRVIGDGGWENVTSDDPDVAYLKEIVDENAGNNPHVGYGNYDGGEEYLDYIRTIFKYSIDNDRFTVNDLAMARSIGGFNLSNIIEDNKKCWSLFENRVGNEVSFKSLRSYNNPYRQTNYTISSTNDTVNVKRFVIENKSGNSNFANYFVDHILPYVEQVLPSTVLYELEGFEAGITGNADYISLNKNVITFNDSKTEDTVILEATDNWLQNNESSIADISPDTGVETDGQRLTVKKKSSPTYGLEKVTFSLDKNRNIYAVLNIRNSMIQLTPHLWDIPTRGGTEVFTVIVDGHEAASDEYRVVSDFPGVTITKSGSKLYVTCPENTSVEDITGSITVVHAIDSSCTDSADLSQDKNELSISATPSAYQFGKEGGTYTFQVKALGGSGQYYYEVESNNWLEVVSKSGDNVTVRANSNMSGNPYPDVTIVFYHQDNSNIHTSVTLTNDAGEALAISVNPTTLTYQYEAQNVQSAAVLTVTGGSGLYKVDKSSTPSWITISTNGNNINVFLTENEGNEEREGSVRFTHMDDSSLSCELVILQQANDQLSIEANPKAYSFPQTESYYEFDVTVYGGSKNFTYIPTGDWFTILKGNAGNYSDRNEYILQVSVKANKKDEDRNGTIKVYHLDDNTVTDEITLTQAAAEKKTILVKDKDGMDITSITDVPCEGYLGGSDYNLTVEIQPEGSGFMVASVPSWVSYTKDGNTIILSISANNGENERSGSITIQHALDPSVTKTVTITQPACEPLILLINGKASESWIVDATGGTNTFNMQVYGGDEQYIIPETESWITIAEGPGVTNAEMINVTVDAQAGLSIGNRSSAITFIHNSDSSVTATLNITQEQGLSIAKNPNEDMLNIPSAGTSKNYTVIARGGDAQWAILSNDCADWVSVVKNGNQVSITVRQNTESDDRECEIVFNHINDDTVTTSIKIKQDGFNASVNIVTDEPKVLEVCSFKSYSYGCDVIDEEVCEECTNFCEKEDIPTNPPNRALEYTYDVVVMGGSGKWEVKGFSAADCCDNDSSDCTNETIDVDWVDTYNMGGQLELTVAENRELCSKTDIANGEGCELGKGKPRSACLVLNHTDDENIVDKLKIEQKGARVNFRNYKISTDPEAVRIPARGEDIVEGEGMTAKYFHKDTLFITSTKDKYINCLYDKTIYVPWNATTDCVDVPPPVPCVLMLDGKEVIGQRTKIRYTQFGYEGGSGSLPISCNNQWNASVTEGSSWISLSTSSGMNGSIRFNVRKNETCEYRTGSILLKACSCDLSGVEKEISIEVNQVRGHECVLNVWPIHPIPSQIPEEGGIYKYRVASYDCDSPVPWVANANGCTVHCVEGYGGGTESVGVTIKVEKSGGTGRSVSVTFRQTGNADCNLQTETITGTQDSGEEPDPGEGDCSCPCAIAWHTNYPYANTAGGGTTFKLYIWQSCDNCVAQAWTLRTDSDEWVHLSKTSGSGTCCATYNCGAPTEGEGEQECLGPAEASGNMVEVTVDANTTGSERRGKLYIENDCGATNDLEIVQGIADGNCKCDCHMLIYTPEKISGVTSEGLSADGDNSYYLVYQSCDQCNPVSWTATVDDRGKDWIKIGNSKDSLGLTASGNGSCCEFVDCTESNADEDVRECFPTADIFYFEIAPNDTGEQRVAAINFENSCGFSIPSGIIQYAGNQCPDGEYVMFADDSDVTMPDSGGTVDEAINRYCTGVTNFSIEIEGEDMTQNITVEPGSGEIDTTKITVGPNTGSTERTIYVTIHPNKDEVSTNSQAISTTFAAPLKTYSTGDGDGIVWVGNEVYSDYTDDKVFLDASSYGNIEIEPFSVSPYERVSYTPDQTDVEDTDEYGDATNSLDPELVELVFGENMEPEERVCSVFFGQKEVDEEGNQQIAEYKIFQDAAVIELRDYRFTACPNSLTVSADGGKLVASIESKANKYINDIKREENLPVGYSCFCEGECLWGCNGEELPDGTTLTPSTNPNVSWVSIDCSTNVITVQPNDDYVNDRVTTLTFKQNESDNLQHILIFQKRKERTFSYNLFTEPLYYRFDLTGGTLQLDVQSHMIEYRNNIEQEKTELGYTVVGTAMWCSIDPKTNMVTCEPNEDGLESRSMTFIFTQDKSGLNHTVLIEQGEQFRYEFEVDPGSLTFEAAGGTQNVSVSSKLFPILNGEELEPRELEYEVTGGSGWCSVNGDGTVVSCGANTDKENARVAVITYIQEKTGLINKVVVFQKKPDILPELYEYIDTADAALQAQIDSITSCTC